MVWFRRFAVGALLLACSAVAAIAAQPVGCMPVTGTYSGVQFAALINSALFQLRGSNSGTAAPADDCSGAPVAGQFWLDTSTSPPTLRLWDGSQGDPLGRLDLNNHLFLQQVGGGLASIASGSTTDLCGTPQNYLTVTGSTTIASFGSSCAVGQIKIVNFASVLAVAYSSGAILLPTSANITTQAGDQAVAVYTGGGIWRLASYTRADGTALTAATIPPVHYAGETILMRGATCPANSVVENGAPYSRTSYPQAFAYLGLAWGPGDGSTTFNVPNSDGQFDRGWTGPSSTVDAVAFTGSISGTTLTVTAITNGALQKGQTITGANIAAGTVITALGSGTGGAGTYTISTSQTISSEAMTGPRVLGLAETDQLQTFQTYYQSAYGVGQTSNANGGSTAVGAVGNNGGYTSPINANFGAETRPKNITALHCIFLVNTP